MDLLKLNNEISSMRSAARQAKVHVMHYLTKSADALQKKKGHESVVAKNKKKAERLREEALVNKILTPDEISKFSLQFDAGLRDKVLNDVDIPLPSKGLARIAAHKAMVEAVENFRKKYPDWQTDLEKSLEKLGTGHRFGTKMKNGRVKAHLVQRERVQEAIDAIRRAQMSWLRRSATDKVKNKSNDEESTKEDLESKKEIPIETSVDKNVDKAPSEISANRKDNKGNEQRNLKTKCGTSNENKKRLHFEEIDEEEDDKGESSESDEEEGIEDDECESQDDESECQDEEGEGESEVESEEEKISLRNEDEAPRKNKLKANKNKSGDLFNEEKKLASKSHQKFADTTLSESDDLEASDTESSGYENDSNSSNNTSKIPQKRNKTKKNLFVPRSREVEVCRFADLLKKEDGTRRNDNISTVDTPSGSEDESESSRLENKGVDPFFVTKNNDFLRLATAKREEPEEPKEPVREGPKWGVEGCENWTGTRKERRARAFGRPLPRQSFKRGGFADFRLPPNSNPRRNAQNVADGPTQSVTSTAHVEPEKLHPSWEAKRKMQAPLLGFQGKKIKFGDD